MTTVSDDTQTSKPSVSKERDGAVPMMQSTQVVTTSLGIVAATPIGGDMNNESEQALGVKRKYTFCGRIRNPRLKFSMRKKWKSEVNFWDESSVNATICYKSKRCFQSVNISFFLDGERRLVVVFEPAWRGTHHETLACNGSFYFDGCADCFSFLVEAFHFSLDL